MNEHPLRVLVVDDEPLARHWVRVQLNKCNLSLVVTEAASAALAKQWLLENSCDVILLDIHMPDLNGLEFAKQCLARSTTHPMPAIIFVTADSNHALEAFDLAVFDYLTKPVSVERLERALGRVIQRIANAPHPLGSKENPSPFVIIESHQQVTRIPLDQVLYFHADSKYVHITTEEQSYLSEDSLNALEKQFEQHVIRAHRSYLVVNQAIEKLVKGVDKEASPDAWFIKVRSSDTYIPISRRQLSAVRDLIQQI